MLDPRITRLAELLCDHSTRLNSEDAVLVHAFDIPEEAVAEIVRVAQSRGAKVAVRLESNLVKRQMLHGMTEANALPPLPDRLSTDPRSPHHVAAIFEHDIGIRFNDKDRLDVEEYCISEGWIRVAAGKTVDRKGQPLLIKLKGRVEAFYR